MARAQKKLWHVQCTNYAYTVNKFCILTCSDLGTSTYGCTSFELGSLFAEVDAKTKKTNKYAGLSITYQTSILFEESDQKIVLKNQQKGLYRSL